MNNSDNSKTIYQALLGVQKEIFAVKKSADNPFFKSKYVDYCSLQRALFPILNEAGIIVTQPTVVIDGHNYVKTVVTLAETGESIESITEIIFRPGDAQAQGSGITYARRYGLMALVAIGADDDDANAASGRTVQTQKPMERKTEQRKRETPVHKTLVKGETVTMGMIDDGTCDNLIAGLKTMLDSPNYESACKKTHDYYNWASDEVFTELRARVELS